MEEPFVSFAILASLHWPPVSFRSCLQVFNVYLHQVSSLYKLRLQFNLTLLSLFCLLSNVISFLFCRPRISLSLLDIRNDNL
jgi:hypothetical protein